MSGGFVAAWAGNTQAGSGNTLVLAAINSDPSSVGANYVAVAFATSGTVVSVVDNKGNSYTKAFGPISASTDSQYLYYAENATCGASHSITITLGSAGDFTSGGAASYSGVVTSSSADKQNTSGSGSGTTLTSGATAATSQADEILLGCGTVSTGSNSTFTGTNGFTVRSQYGNAGVSAISYLEDKVVAATGAYTSSSTWGSTGGAWVQCILTVKLAGGGGGGGGSVVNESLTESVTALDSLSNTISAGNALSEAGSAGESLAPLQVLNVSTTEAEAAIDTLAPATLAFPVINEALAASESLGQQVNANPSVLELANANDSLANQLDAVQPLSEAGNATDDLTATGGIVTGGTEFEYDRRVRRL